MQQQHSFADDFDDTVKIVQIARGVTAATAAELAGLPASWIGQLEGGVARDGVFCVGNLQESSEVRSTNDEP